MVVVDLLEEEGQAPQTAAVLLAVAPGTSGLVGDESRTAEAIPLQVAQVLPEAQEPAVGARLWVRGESFAPLLDFGK